METSTTQETGSNPFSEADLKSSRYVYNLDPGNEHVSEDQIENDALFKETLVDIPWESRGISRILGVFFLPNEAIDELPEIQQQAIKRARKLEVLKPTDGDLLVKGGSLAHELVKQAYAAEGRTLDPFGGNLF